MAENTAIEWARHTFNPWTGCTKVSPACDNCYAEGWAKRSGHVEWGAKADRRRTSDATWLKMIKWNEEAHKNGEMHTVFACSLADIFDNHKSIEQSWRDDFWDYVRRCKNLIMLLLTKRPQNIKKYLPDFWDEIKGRVWLGTTVENQWECDRRIPVLAEYKNNCAGTFISMEPLLEFVDLLYPTGVWPDGPQSCCSGHECGCMGQPTEPPLLYYVDWVICGGESGPGSRPSNVHWFDDIQHQCQRNRVPFFFKQHGDWFPYGSIDASGCQNSVTKGKKVGYWKEWETSGFSVKLGKKKAGRYLNGQTYSERPLGIPV